MPDDYYTKIATNLVTGLNTIAHALTAAGAALVPDEYHVVPRGANPGYNFSSVPADSTNIYISATGQFSADVFARYNHSVIR